MKSNVYELSGKNSLFTWVFLQIVPLLLFTTSIIAIPQALATTSVITTSSTIANGAFNPAPIILGAGFAADVDKFDFAVDMGKTNLEYDSVAFIDASHLRFNFRGTASTGTLAITAESSAFDPASGVLSHELTINIAAPLIGQSIIFAKLNPMTVGGKDQAPIASSSSFLNVEIMSNTPSVCTIDFAKVHAVAAGTCSLKASQPGNERYAPAPVITQSVVVSANPTEKISETKPVDVATTLGSAMYDPDSIDGGYASVLISGSGPKNATLVKLLIPSNATTVKTVFLISAFSSDEETAAGYFIARIAAVASDGASIHRFKKAIQINIPAGANEGFPYWSYDGNRWYRLLKLETKELPSNRHAGYFVEDDGRIAIFSDYLMLVGFRKPQTPLSIISPVDKLSVLATAALKSVGGSGLGQLVYKSSTDSICSISQSGVLTGLSEGNCVVSAVKAASEIFADTSSKQISIKIIGVSNISKEVAASVNTHFLNHSLTFMKINKSQTLDVGLCSTYANEKAILYLGTKAKNGTWVWKPISMTQLDNSGAGQFTVTTTLNAGHRIRVLVNDVIQMNSDI